MGCTFKKLDGGMVQCKETGCIIPEEECDTHERAYAGKLRKLTAAPPTVAELVKDQGELLRAQAAELEKLRAQLGKAK